MTRELKAKSAVLTGARNPIEIWVRDVPLPGPGCINIKVLRAGVCGTDPHLWNGDFEFEQAVVLGHEGLGRVIELGEGVTTDHASQPIAIGDVVYWNPIRPCNACYDCTVTEDFTACTRGTFWSPAKGEHVWASYTEVATMLPNNSFYKVDPEVPLDAYIALGCALPTMLQAVDNLGGITRGSNVVVQGAGPVGLAAIMLASLAGAANIVCIEGNESRLKRALDFGATIPVDFRKEEFKTKEIRAAYIAKTVGAPGINLVIECSGNASAFEEGINLLSRSGRYLLVGTWAGASNVTLSPFQIVQKGLKIVGSVYASPAQYYKATKLVGQVWKRVPLVECVTHKYKLGDAQQALEDVGAGKAVKAAIYPQDAEGWN
jgi:threonine dehydrogenase-like Zn-dependent dehydrogenase